jgi:nucleoside-diphosphate-sugar epimerase
MTAKGLPLRLFLAGASGAVGRRLVPLLIERGHHVTGLTRSAAAAASLRAQGADAVVADVYDADALTEAVKAAAPDVVMHQLTDLSGVDFAANTAIREAGTRNLVDAALAAGVGRVVAQSVAWAYEGGDSPADESTPLDLGADGSRATTVRGVVSLEAAVRELPEWVVLRYGLFYGPGTWYTPQGSMADKARAGGLVANRDIASFVHVDDAAAAAAAALDWPSGAVNVCDDEPAAGSEWLPAFCRSVGAPEPGHSDAPRQGWARGADNRLAREGLGWTPSRLSWRDGFTAG